MIRPLALLILCFTTLPAVAEPFSAEVSRWNVQDLLARRIGGDLLFVGSSSIRRWEHLARDFPEYDVVQRGFGGSTFVDVLRNFNELVRAHRPRLVVVFEGANDIASGKSVDAVFEDYLTFTQRVHDDLPETKILFIGITPNPSRWECCQEKSMGLGLRIADHCEGDPRLGYIDTPAHFLKRGAPKGEAFTSLFCDGLHLTEEGYELWSKVIGQAVREAVPPTKKFTLSRLSPQPGRRMLIDFGTNLPVAPRSQPIWNRWHPGEEGSVLAGEHLAGIVDITGKPTGISLTITGGFQTKGSTAKKKPTETDDDLADMWATSDGFVANEYDSPGGFLLEGLNPDLAYRFRFVGSKKVASEFVVTGAGSPAVTTSGKGTAIAVVDKARPDKWGRFYIDLRLAQGKRAYLSAMELTVLEP